jgi:ribosomal protein S18 acetylase RimI-like enzyme
MSVLVRPATVGDAAGLAQLWIDSGRFFARIDPDTAQEPDPDGLVEWFAELYQRLVADPSMLALVAEVDGGVGGALSARLLEPLPSAARQVQSDFRRRRVHIDSLTVAEPHRRSGIGTALMTAAERWAVERGAEVVTLESNAGNPTSMPFYEHRMGYRRQEVVFRKVLDKVLDAPG